MGSDDALTQLRNDDLDWLRYHWGDAYRIWFGAGQFCAMRRDTGAVVRCVDAGALREEIRMDYEARPVPRP